MRIKILADGGEMKPGPAISQKLGPVGINMGQVISKINEATKDFKGLKVPVELDVNAATKEFEVLVFSPPASELLKKELKIDKGSGSQKKLQMANASIEQIISVAKQKMPNMLSRNLKSAVMSIAGTAVSLGILIENKPAVEVVREIEEGKYDKEISEEKTKADSAKMDELNKYFSDIKSKQDQLAKQEKAAADAEKEKKNAAAATAKPAATPSKK